MLYVLMIFVFARASTCLEKTRAVFDVGSGTTKLNVSRVEVCPGHTRVLRTLDDQSSRDVPLEANREADDRISEKGIARQMEAVAQLKARVRELVPKDAEVEYAAAGTHAFRTAKNQAEIARRFEQAGVPIVALTQEQEALTGYHAVRACANEPLLVWDIGGGSMQFTRRADPPRVTGLALGAESFKRKLRDQLALERTPKCPVPNDTVNPIRVTNGAVAIAVAERAAPRSLGPLPACVVGIGGLHVRGVEGAITKNWDAIRVCACGPNECEHARGRYTRREVECLASFLSEKDDCAPEIKGPYSSVAVSNLYLVLGFMRALHLDSVRTEAITMGHGLAIDQRLLRFRSSRN